jgi:serine protease
VRYFVALAPLFVFAAFVNDPLRSQQTYLDEIRAPVAWDLSMGPIRVALMDMGNPCLHADLVGKCDPGFTATWAQQESEYDESWEGHAVSTGSILAANTNNAEGIAGVAPDARLVPVKVCTRAGRCADQTGEDVDGVIAGLRWIIAQGDIKVVNASISSLTYFDEIQRAVCDARAQGIAVVTAAGNNGYSWTQYPDGTYENAAPLYPLASTDCMIVVGGTDPQSTRAPWVDLVARNLGVVAAVCTIDYTRPFGVPCPAVGYRAPSGTSFSAPQVTGGVAMIRSLPRAWCNCGADVDYIESVLKITALPFVCLQQTDPSGANFSVVNGCGAGTPDLGAAVRLSVPTPTPTVTPTATPIPARCWPPRAQRCRA